MATLALLRPLATAAASYGPRIHDMPEDERPRERLLRHGAAALSNAELLAILLRTGVAGENVLSMAQRLLTNRRGLRGIATASFGELSLERGISEAKYCQLIAGFELGRRLASLGAGDRVTVQGPQDIANLLQAEMALLAQEHLRVVLLSTKNQVLGGAPGLCGHGEYVAGAGGGDVPARGGGERPERHHRPQSSLRRSHAQRAGR